MKNKTAVPTLTLIALATFGALWLFAAEAPLATRYEYATIRWDGRENSHIVRPGGQVEMTSNELRKVRRPDRADERAFYMNLLMNGLTKEGYEFAGMTGDEIVMKRIAPR
jgi:hypothetical protein